MKFRNLNLRWQLFLSGILLYGALMSCNNSTKSENKSTDTSTNTNTTTSPGYTDTATKKSESNNSDTSKTSKAPTGKRVGKVGIAAAARVEHKEPAKTDVQGYYDYTDVAPTYPGGQTALEDYISNHITYPDDALDNNVEGTVNVIFTIDENGKVANAKAVNTNLGHGLEEAAVKAVTDMPAWTPGKVKGKKVRAWYTLPVTFKIEG
jgi:TonB family protein